MECKYCGSTDLSTGDYMLRRKSGHNTFAIVRRCNNCTKVDKKYSREFQDKQKLLKSVSKYVEAKLFNSMP